MVHQRQRRGGPSVAAAVRVREDGVGAELEPGHHPRQGPRVVVARWQPSKSGGWATAVGAAFVVSLVLAIAGWWIARSLYKERQLASDEKFYELRVGAQVPGLERVVTFREDGTLIARTQKTPSMEEALGSIGSGGGGSSVFGISPALGYY